MTTHLTARIAWHDNGWNGRICSHPELNTYCVGTKSFPGDVILRERNLDFEKDHAGQSICNMGNKDLPPCIYSINAFGEKQIQGYSNPPAFFYGGADRAEWEIPPATICAWPYEAMYSDEVKITGKIDNSKRIDLANKFFAELTINESLVFYYANYSNPFTEEENPKYVIIGVSRIKNIGKNLTYPNAIDKIKERFADGMVWARNVTSHYPDEGFCIPYHLYRDQPEFLEKILVTPENPSTCKYGARHLSDDCAIGMLEQLLGVIYQLKAIEDTQDDWNLREKWLLSQIGKLWHRRGLYPGLLVVMDRLEATFCIKNAKQFCEKNEEKKAYKLFFNALDNKKECPELNLLGENLNKISRSWLLLDESKRNFIKSVAVRVDLNKKQLETILGEKRRSHGLPDDLSAIVEDPYLLSELYRGETPDDFLAWSTIDRGVFPSPELGGEVLCDMLYDDPRRFRSLCVEQLRKEPNQTFRLAETILHEVNHRMDRMPEWKRRNFTKQYFEVDREPLEKSLVIKSKDGQLYLYLKSVYEDERKVEDVLMRLMDRYPIALTRPIPQGFWRRELFNDESNLAKKSPSEYETAIEKQAEQCDKIFRLPFSVISGHAGTGKTTIIRALVSALRQVEGDGAPINIMTPTGKATDRVRAIFQSSDTREIDVSTIHSFLAVNGWLNDNLTFKRQGGKQCNLEGTIIIDESSMLDLALAATFMKSINWLHVKRLILVGDHNQLPPIGRGRLFSDIIEWLAKDHAEHLAILKTNMRQMENKIDGNGQAILDLAELFLVDNVQNKATAPAVELLLQKIHQGGKIDEDLYVIYWDSPDDLNSKLLSDFIAELPHEGIGTPIYKFWQKEVNQNKPERLQVLSPRRGEFYGVEALNEKLQSALTKGIINRIGAVDGVTLNDKVIQIKNRTTKNAIWGYDFNKKQSSKIDLFNGEIGYVNVHPFDLKDLKKAFQGHSKAYLKRFIVKFARKEHINVSYGRDCPKKNGTESVEQNLELAYAISIHKAQGSEFEKTFVVIPSTKRPLSAELIYTALTRAKGHCRLYIERDIKPILDARRKENSQSILVSSSIFGGFRAVDERLLQRNDWYESGKIHEALSGDMVRSKSEVIIANLLHQAGIPFTYEEQLIAGDGTSYLPDFTLTIRGDKFYWEHWGMMNDEAYIIYKEQKTQWYDKHFKSQLIETEEGIDLSKKVQQLIDQLLK
ncbi:AAA family ATPase [Bartonella sp. HY406]|uniref:AAA family ATPase n=1 Tax=Bartonella sp. HY406 TaxID=2979331 RepID=UPI0021C5AFC3|nr:AAA family ATPase [Bartonella sp. HY406]UXN05111.1 AAA family ATPase [Bartonella sp. HY406]